MKRTTWFLLLLLLVSNVARGDSSTTSGSRVIENPTASGDLVLRANVAGSGKVDVLNLGGALGRAILSSTGHTGHDTDFNRIIGTTIAGYPSGITMGASNNGYPLVGYNFRTGTSTDTWTYNGTDFFNGIQLISGGFKFLTAPSGSGGGAITATNILNLTNNVVTGITTLDLGRQAVAELGTAILRIHGGFSNASTGRSASLSIDPSSRGLDLTTWNDFKFYANGNTEAPFNGTVTITNATPAVFTANAHGLVAGDRVFFQTTGSLPTGLSTGTVYFVIAAGLTTNAFEVSTSFGGAALNTSSAGSGTHTFVSPTSGGALVLSASASGTTVDLGASKAIATGMTLTASLAGAFTSTSDVVPYFVNNVSPADTTTTVRAQYSGQWNTGNIWGIGVDGTTSPSIAIGSVAPSTGKMATVYLSMLSSTGAVSLGTPIASNFNGPAHISNGHIWGGGSGVGAGDKQLVIGTNTSIAAAGRNGRTATATTGAAILFQNTTPDTNDTIVFYANKVNDAATAGTATDIGAATSLGAWRFGIASGSTVTHTFYGNQIQVIPNAGTTQAQMKFTGAGVDIDATGANASNSVRINRSSTSGSTFTVMRAGTTGEDMKVNGNGGTEFNGIAGVFGLSAGSTALTCTALCLNNVVNFGFQASQSRCIAEWQGGVAQPCDTAGTATKKCLCSGLK